MTGPQTPMRCPRCGTTMNHHAEKLILSVNRAIPIDPALGGYIEEMHACPRCGSIESRRPA
jgi:ribosomal protein S27AE